MDRVSERSRPVAWTIAGSDSGGGAGIQVDLLVMNAFGIHGCSIITAITAQNTLGVQSSEPVSASIFRDQLNALSEDLSPAAIKTGMLGSLSNCNELANFLRSHTAPRPPFVCDPVLRSTSGAELLEPEALDLLVRCILPHVTVLTPNLPEAEVLLGTAFSSIEDAADQFLGKGAQSVLIKGGHAEGNVCRDYWTDGTQAMWLSSPRISSRASHGTGCILSSAIAAGLANGQSVQQAIVDAKTFLNQCLRSPANVGRGVGPMQIRPFLNAAEDRPSLQ